MSQKKKSSCSTIRVWSILHPLFLLVFLLAGPFYSNAQTSILYTAIDGSPLQLNNVDVCQNELYYNAARVVISENQTNNIDINIKFPPGIEYVFGSMQVINSTPGISISEVGAIGNNTVQFEVSPNNVQAGDFFTFRYARKANCDAIDHKTAGGVFKDEITLIYPTGSTTEDDPNLRLYDIKTASLSILGQGPIVASLGETLSRRIDITNGGLGFLDEVEFKIIEGDGLQTTVLTTATGTTILPSQTIGDTIFYTIGSSLIAEYGDGDVYFENGEQLQFFRAYDVSSCANTDSYYQASWGCASKSCQQTPLLQQSTILENVIPTLVVSMPNPNLDYCFEGSSTHDGGTAVVQQFKVQNTGTGPATNLTLEVFGYQRGGNTGHNYFQNEDYLIYDESGNFLGKTNNYNSIRTTTALNGDCVNTVVDHHISFGIGDVVIAAGTSIFVHVNTYTPNLACMTNCTSKTRSWFSFSTAHTYQDQCEQYNYSVTNQRHANRAHNFQNYNVELPVDVLDGDEFDAEVYYERLYTRVKSATEGATYLVVDLNNTDLVYNGGATIAAPFGVLPVTQSGDSLLIKLPNNLTNAGGGVNVPLKAICGTGGTQSVKFYHLAQYHDDCNYQGVTQYCENKTLRLHCPTPCPKGGATPYRFTLERTTRGLEDYDDNHLPDNNNLAHPDSIKLHSAVNGDTVLGTWYIKVNPNTVGPNAGLPFNYTYVEFDLKDHPSNACNNPGENQYSNVFTPLPNAEITVYPTGGGAPITCTATPTITNRIAKYDLSNCQSSWSGGDSIVVKAQFVANASIMRQGFVAYVSNNEVYSSYIQNPTGPNPSDENKYTCNHFDDYMNVHNMYHSPYSPQKQDIEGCDNEFTMYIRRYINKQTSPVWFPNEYRNFTIFDEYEVEWPDELVYRPGSAEFSGVSIPDQYVSQSNGILRFTNLKQFYTTYGGTFTPTDEVDNKWVRWSVDPSCDADPGFVYKGRFTAKTIGNGINTPATQFDSHAGCSSKHSAYSSMEYSSPQPFLSGGGDILLTKTDAEWLIYLNNGSNKLDAYNTWFYIEDISGSLDSFSITDGTNVYYPDANGFFQIGTNPSQSATAYYVNAKVTACADAEIRLHSGYHCSEYPSNFAAIDCSDYLTLTSKNLGSEVQVSLEQQPSVPLALCDIQTIKIKQTSSQAAFLDDPKLIIKVPTGVTMPNTISVEYPANSGQIEQLTPAISGNDYTVNLEDHTQLTMTGLPGTEDALSPDARSAAISFDFDTDCNFLSGDNFIFQIEGKRPCGAPAINNGSRLRTADLTVAGVDLPFISLASEIDNVLNGCEPKTQNASIEFVALNANATSETDTIFIILEEGLEFVPGSWTCQSPGTCLVFSGVNTLPNGDSEVILTMPAGGFDLSSGSVTTAFDYDIKAANTSSCNALKSVTIRSVSNLGNIPCADEPTGLCPSLEASSGQVTADIRITKTELSFTDNFTFCHTPAGVTFDGEVKVDSVGIPAGASIVLDVYCLDAAGNDLGYSGEVSIAGPIDSGTVATFTGTLLSTCDGANGLRIVANNVSANGNVSCLCGTTSFTFDGVPELNYTVTSTTPVSCFGDSDGQATIAGTGGNGSLIYTWDNSEVTNTPVNLNAGINTFTIKDEAGCLINGNVNIGEPDELLATISADSIETCDSQLGTATVTPTGGNGNYTYLWSTGETGATATQLVQGTNTCTITDAKGCTTQISTHVTISETMVPTIDPSPFACLTTNDQLTANLTGGIGPFTYNWVGPTGSLGGNQTIGINSAGTYYLTITDDIGCTTTASQQIYNTYTATVVNATPQVCEGDTATLSAAANNSVSYLWSTGAITQAIEVVPTTPASTYTVTVTNDKGCEAEATATINVDSAPSPQLTGPAAICVGEFTTVSASTFGFWISDDTNIAQVDGNGIVSGIGAGTTNINYIDVATGCESINPVSVTVNPLPTIAVDGPSQICIGATTTLLANATGTWTALNPQVAAVNSSTGVVTGVSSGNALFEFTNTATGCSDVISQGIQVQPDPTINVPELEICLGENTTATATTAGSWTSSIPSIATIDNNGLITGIAAGKVVIIFTDAITGCSTLSDSLEVLALPVVDLNGNSDVCVGESFTVLSGEPGTWSSENSNIATIDANGLVTGVAPGNTRVRFTSATTGCVSEYSGLITVKALPIVQIIGNTFICIGGTTNLLPSTGGNWTSQDNSIATVDNFGKVTGVSPGQVSFTFTDATTGCSQTLATPITVLTPPDIDLTGPAAICVNTSTLLQPATGGYWTSSDNTIATVSANGQLLGISPGMVTLTFTEASSGCEAIETLTIEITAAPTLNISGSNLICVGDSTTLTADQTGTWVSNNPAVASIDGNGLVIGLQQGFTRFTFYSDAGCSAVQSSPVFVNGGDNPILLDDPEVCIGGTINLLPNSGGTWSSSDNSIATIANDGTATAVSAGVVTFTFTNSNTGCISAESAQVTVVPSIETIITGSDEICIGETSSIAPTANGSWVSNNPSVAVIDHNGIITGLAPGKATFTFTSTTTGCQSAASDTVEVLDRPTVSINGADELCIGEQSQVFPSTGGTWVSSNSAVATVTNSGVVTAIAAGNVTFTFTSTTTGCISSPTLPITVYGDATTSFLDGDEVCIGNTIQALPSSGGTWTSDSPAVASVDNSGLITGLTAGTALLSYTDNSTGCTSSDVLLVTVRAATNISIVGDEEICIGTSTQLSTGSIGIWSSSNPQIASITNGGQVTGKAPGKVVFTFTDSNGCTSTSISDTVNVISCIANDFNVITADDQVNSSVHTNDFVPNGTTYGTPILMSKPNAGIGNLTMLADGSYSFTGSKAGKYLYRIPICLPDVIQGCTNSLIEFTVLDDVFGKANPVSNYEMATTYNNANPLVAGQTITVDAVANDHCVKMGGCSLNMATTSLKHQPSNGVASIDNNGHITYTPNADFIGMDTIYYEICSGGICTETMQVITVNDVTASNSTVASDDFAWTMKETPVTGNILANDMDGESDNMVFAPVGSAANPVAITGGSYYIDNTGNYTFIPAQGFYGPTEIIYSVCDDHTNTACRNATLHILVFDDLKLEVKVFLEGALMSNGNAVSATGTPLMRDDLRVNPFDGKQYIPAKDPYTYSTDLFNDITSKFTKVGPGLISTNQQIPDSAAVFSVTGENAIVDWVFVELRSKSNMLQTVATRSGLLQRDGDVVDLDGVSPLRFKGINQDSFYVVINHRSHLGAMSGLVKAGEVVDFRSTSTEVFNYGTSIDANLNYAGLEMNNNVKVGWRALWAGDFNADGAIRFSGGADDQNVILINVLFHPVNINFIMTNFDNCHGYYHGDFNMNGKAKFDNPNDDKNSLYFQVFTYPLNTGYKTNFAFFLEQVPNQN